MNRPMPATLVALYFLSFTVIFCQEPEVRVPGPPGLNPGATINYTLNEGSRIFPRENATVREVRGSWVFMLEEGEQPKWVNFLHVVSFEVLTDFSAALGTIEIGKDGGTAWFISTAVPTNARGGRDIVGSVKNLLGVPAGEIRVELRAKDSEGRPEEGRPPDLLGGQVLGVRLASKRRHAAGAVMEGTTIQPGASVEISLDIGDPGTARGFEIFATLKPAGDSGHRRDGQPPDEEVARGRIEGVSIPEGGAAEMKVEPADWESAGFVNGLQEYTLPVCLGTVRVTGPEGKVLLERKGLLPGTKVLIQDTMLTIVPGRK